MRERGGIQFVQVRARKVSTGEIFENFFLFGAPNSFPLIQISRFAYPPKINLCSSTHHLKASILLKNNILPKSATKNT